VSAVIFLDFAVKYTSASLNKL